MRTDQDKPFVVVTDATDYAVWAILEQIYEKKRRRPVAFFSHSFNPGERNYETYERELLASITFLASLLGG